MGRRRRRSSSSSTGSSKGSSRADSSRSSSNSRSSSAERPVAKKRRREFVREYEKEVSTRSGAPRSREDAVQRTLENDCEIRVLWKQCHCEDGRDNFDAWNQLLNLLDEKKAEVEVWRPALLRFLDRWPLCFGFWCKWARLEANAGNNEKANQVYEHAVTAFPHSVDIWRAWLRFMRESSTEELQDKIQKLVERATDAVGLNWRTESLWVEALSATSSDAFMTTSLLDRLIRVPTPNLETYFMSLCGHLTKCDLNSTLPPEELETLSLTVSLEGTTEEINGRILARALEKRKEIYENTTKERDERIQFERQIKRPYFHVKPLEKSQLDNWTAYLDFEITQSTVTQPEVVKALFERCLVSCALYEEFWLKYGEWSSSHASDSVVRDVYSRGLFTHCRRSILLALAFSAFEESRGEISAARRILSDFNDYCPGHLLIDIRNIGIERRHRNSTKPKDVGEVSDHYKRMMRHRGSFPAQHAFLAIKHSRYLLRVANDTGAASRVIHQAIRKDKTNEQLYLQLVEIALHENPMEEAEICQTFDFCINSPDLRLPQKIRFSQRKLDFLEDFSSDVSKIQAHLLFHCRLIASDNPDPLNPRRTLPTLPETQLKLSS